MAFRTIRDAAKELDISEGILRRAVMAGSVPSLKLGNRMLVDVDAARSLLPKPAGVGIEELSGEIGLHVAAIRRAIREGWMPCTKPGKAYLFQVDEVRAAIEQRIREQAKHSKG